MVNSQSKSLGLEDSSLTKTEAKTQNSLNNTNDFDYRLKVRHVVDIYIYIYIYIDIVTDVPDTSGESKNNIGAAFGGPKRQNHEDAQTSSLLVSKTLNFHSVSTAIL